ncbi:MAG: GH1 family beta-glucosidase [Nannocystales bacterium]
MNDRTFPSNFLWGAATSSYQIEGAVDTRGPSIWDTFCRVPGAVEDGSDGAVACDHLARMDEDVALMKRLGLAAYRFSISWPRVMPQGRGACAPEGIDVYSRLVDQLLEAGIEPWVTLYHWDLPQALEDAGGWPVRDTASAFVDYATAMAEALGDRVQHWITHNEPWCAAMLGYQFGRHAPGRTDLAASIGASHHLLLSHGWATRRLREALPSSARIGITLNLAPVDAASSSAADREQRRHEDGAFNRWFLEPLYGQGYPEDIVRDYIDRGGLPDDGMASWVHPGDLEAIAVPTDFLGINYYYRKVERADVPDNDPPTVVQTPPEEWTDMGWEVFPEGLWALLQRVHQSYAPGPMYITENGASYDTGPQPGGAVPDVRRIQYFRDHFAQALRAIQDGVPLHGYFAWSLLDNFEWDRGYTQRFGMVWVDYTTQKRLPKDSAHYYAEVIARNAVVE